jgi:hypothetical protein
MLSGLTASNRVMSSQTGGKIGEEPFKKNGQGMVTVLQRA